MILTDENFASIEAAVEESRGVFETLRKFIVWTLPTDGGQSLALLLAVVAGLPLPLQPALTTAALRGVAVQILVPQRSDSRLVTAAARSYFEELVRVGVRVHEYASSMLHAKTLVVDGMALVGTANMDNRSFRLNFEVAAALFDQGLAELLAEAFRADLQHAVEYRLRIARRTPVWQRMSEATARLLSPLL